MASPMRPWYRQEAEGAHEDEASPVHQSCSGDDGSQVAELTGSTAEKVACDRCRRRKIKCDRVHPCSQCLRAESQCSYPAAQKREKRQRVLLSSIYESRIEHISQKIDHLTRVMQQLQDTTRQDPSYRSTGGSGSRHNVYSPRAPLNETGGSRLPGVAAHQGSIDKSIFSLAISGTEFLEDTVQSRVPSDGGGGGGGQSPCAAAGVRSALHTLQTIVSAQAQRNAVGEDTAPFPASLPRRTTVSDHPLVPPPIDNVMACLRMAQDHATTILSWFGELISLGDFTLYVMRIYSPGPITDAELIIAYVGLFWVFTECAAMAQDKSRKDLERQARACEISLQPVLSGLRFHIPVTVESILAMYLATLYSFQKGRVLASWDFISKASLQAQALGLHTGMSISTNMAGEQRRRSCLFWCIYALEKGVSLRLARPSTIRDRDITIPKPAPEPNASPVIMQSLLDCVNAARIYGLVYDDILSPRAMAQPLETRIARIHALADEWRDMSASKAQQLTKWTAKSEEVHESGRAEFTRYAQRASDYVFLTAIYSAAPDRTSAPSLSAECTSAARIALQSLAECTALLAHHDVLLSSQIELWVNGGMLLLPFLPFNVVLYSAVRTDNLDDLQRLGALVRAMERLADKPDYAGCASQARIFRAMYDVAVRYVKGSLGQGEEFNSAAVNLGVDSADHMTLIGAVDVTSSHPSTGQDGLEEQIIDDNLLQADKLSNDIALLLPKVQSSDNHPWMGLGSGDMDLDHLDAQLDGWFDQSGDSIN